MLNRILHSYLRWKDRGYLIPFLEGMTHLGRPSSVLFPLELMEQGAAILVSGLNNTMAIQSNLDWVWPLWVERQADPEGKEFIPTAINLIMTNLTCRNWTSLGLPDSPREGMVDPAGMLTLHPYGWSVFPYLRAEGRDFLPPRLAAAGLVAPSLREGSLPWVVTRYDAHPALDWTSEAVALEVEGEEAIGFTHTLANFGPAHLSLRFGLAIRPYNPLTIGHINSIRYKGGGIGGLFKVNGEPGLLLAEEPSRVVLSDRHHGDPLLRPVLIAGRRALTSRSGIACGLAEWDVELPPGATRVIEAFGVLDRRMPKPAAARWSRAAPAAAAAAKTARRAALREEAETGLALVLPEPRLQEAFDAVKGHLHVFDDGDRFSPGTFLYHTHWFRDSAFIALAFENLGWGRRVVPKLLAYPDHQTPDGFFKSQKGEWDSNGEAMWTLVNHVRRGGDARLLERLFPSLLKGARWIDRMRHQTCTTPAPHFGLMPAGFSAEHFGPNDHYFWDNLWSVAGLEAAGWAAGRLGKAREGAWLADLAADFRGDLASAMDWAWKKNGRGALPCSPYRTVDSAAIGNLVGLSPLDVTSPSEPWVAGTVDHLAAHHLRDGLFFQRIIHTGLNPYLSVQLARAMMALDDPRWRRILDALLRHASPTWTWPEAMHPRMFGGCMGDGDHGWSAAEFVSLLRDMMVSERGGCLYLLPHAPAEWFTEGRTLEVRRAPTLHGTVDCAFRQGPESATFTWSIRRQPHQDSAPARLVIPADRGLLPGPEAERRGRAWHIPLPGDAGSLNLAVAAPAAGSRPPDTHLQRIEHA